jgi:hypothetical protein
MTFFSDEVYTPAYSTTPSGKGTQSHTSGVLQKEKSNNKDHA